MRPCLPTWICYGKRPKNSNEGKKNVGGLSKGQNREHLNVACYFSIVLFSNITSSVPFRFSLQIFRPDELKAIKAWLTIRAKAKPQTEAFFISERQTPLSRKTAWLAIRTYGERAGLSLPAHPHMLRHACGFALTDQGADTRLIQDYFGHRNIQQTVIYTATYPANFERLRR